MHGMEEDFYIKFVTFMHKFILKGDVSAVDHWRMVYTYGEVWFMQCG